MINQQSKAVLKTIFACFNTFFIIFGLIAVIIVLTKRLEDKIKTKEQESLPKIVAIGNINEFNGFIQINSTFNLSDPTAINYYLSIRHVETFPSQKSENEDDDNISLYLTKFNDIEKFLFNDTDNVDENKIIIPNVNKALEEEEDTRNPFFPYRLPNDYKPHRHRLGVFVKDESPVEIILGTVDLMLVGVMNNTNSNDGDTNSDAKNGDVDNKT